MIDIKRLNKILNLLNYIEDELKNKNYIDYIVWEAQYSNGKKVWYDNKQDKIKTINIIRDFEYLMNYLRLFELEYNGNNKDIKKDIELIKQIGELELEYKLVLLGIK